MWPPVSWSHPVGIAATWEVLRNVTLSFPLHFAKFSEASPCQMTIPGFGTPVDKAAASIHIFT